MSTFLSVPGIAERLDVAYATARLLVLSGAIPAPRVGRQFRIAESDLDAYLAAARVVPTTPPAA